MFSRPIIVAALIVLLLSDHAAGKTADPVVFIPGFLGSKLCEKPSGRRLWPSLDFRRLQLHLLSSNDVAPDSVVPCGILDVIPSIWPPFKEDQYADLIAHFNQLGYNQDNLLVFDYDWRLSNFVNARYLKQEIIAKFGAREVILIGHSMGGIIARILAQDRELGGENLVKRILTLGTPHRGAADVFEMAYQGLGEQEGIKNWFVGGIPLIRAIALSFPSVYELLPSYQNCCYFVSRSGASEKFDPFKSDVWKRFEWYQQVFPTQKQINFLASALYSAERLHKQILHKKLLSRLEGDLRLIATGKYSTRSRVHLFDDGSLKEFVFKNGDGTVPLLSAINDRKTSDLGIAPSVEQHGRIFSTDSAKEYLTNVLGDAPVPAAPAARAVFLAAGDGSQLFLDRWHYRILPSIGPPASKARFVLELVGSAKLALADLKIKIAISQTELALKKKSSSRLISEDVELTNVRLEGEFEIPSEEGAYRVEVTMPGVGVFYDFAFASRIGEPQLEK